MAPPRPTSSHPLLLLLGMVILLLLLVDYRGGVLGQTDNPMPSSPPTPCNDATEFYCGTYVNNATNLPTAECIPAAWVCDNKTDCVHSRGDRTDEDPIMCTTCPAGQFKCPDIGCVPERFRCDRFVHCKGGVDEVNCTYTPCAPDLFSCSDGTHCVHKEATCDGNFDCGDRSDEADSFCYPKPLCADNQFECGNKTCIPLSQVCSGSQECSDGSDEKSCATDECSDGTHNCTGICTNINIGYTCSCHAGYKLLEDKLTCQDIDECNTYPLKCTQYCQNTPGGYNCSCDRNYRLASDGKKCKANDSVEPYLLFANRYQIRNMSLTGTLLGKINENNEYVHVLDTHYQKKFIFFADAGKRQIRRINFDGSNETRLIWNNLPLVEGLAVDWVTEKLYWTDSRLGAVLVANMNGTSMRTLHKERTKYPRGIVVHPRRGILFWTDWSLGAFIARMGMDGSSMTKLITRGLFWPNALTIDYVTERLWWADAHLDRIETSFLDGTGRYTVISNLPHIYGINVFEEWMYWTDWNIKTIEKANRFTGIGRTKLVNTSHQPYDIHVIHPLRQNTSLTSECNNNNGGCEYLCLLAPAPPNSTDENTYVCSCPEHFVLAADGRSCSANCTPAQFECPRPDHRCIPRRALCDGVENCAGGEDEMQSCPSAIPCKEGQFHCGDGQCVLDPRDVCDEVFDCRNRHDEDESVCENRVCLPTEFRCNSGKCINIKWRCDSEKDCPDNDDEQNCDAPRNCTEDEFRCDNGKCIPSLWRCDHDNDCGDHSDEPGAEHCPARCPEGWNRCETNVRCVPKLLYCDGDDDCRDNSDEDPKNCPKCEKGEFECASSPDNTTVCIPQRWRCDFQSDCPDDSDEDVEKCKPHYRPCEENEFRCKNSKCIRERKRCNHEDDCGDESDEMECSTYTCPEGAFQCRSGHCILASLQCDGIKHCEDFSDELGCPTRYPGGKYCPDDKFQCKNTVCVPPSWLCDTEDDCGDRSDEDPALCADRPCEGNRFRCNNNYCIYAARTCNGVDNCGDGSDENNFTLCPQEQHKCGLQEFRCHSASKCIPQTKVCDERNDCGDNSDEHGCHAYTGSTCSQQNGGCERNCTQGTNRYYCSCGEGYRIDPNNGKLCIDINECASWATNRCDQECLNTDGSYVCKCAANFTKLVAHSAVRCKGNLGQQPSVLVSAQGEIRWFIKSERRYTTLVTSQTEIRSLDVNGPAGLVYWTDPTRKTVFRAAVPANTTLEPVPQDLGVYSDVVPEGVAVDWVSRNIYVTDAKSGRIVVGKDDGRYMTTIVEASSVRRPTKIAVSPGTGLMFWVDPLNAKIESAWMDGSNIRSIVSVNISVPSAIVVDHYMDGRLFWADMKRDVIESSRQDGSDRVILFQKDVGNPVGLDVFESQVLWISKLNMTLFEHDKFSRGVQVRTELRVFLPQDVKILHRQKQPEMTAMDRCAKKGCFPLCVPIPNDAKCLCPDGIPWDIEGGVESTSKCKIELEPEKPTPAPCICHNGGTCIVSPASDKVCLCKPGFTGESCNLKDTPPPPPSKPTDDGLSGSPVKNDTGDLLKVIIPIVVIIILVLLAIGILLFILHRRGKLRAKGSHGVFREGPAGLDRDTTTNEPHYEPDAMTVRYDTSTNGISNPIYDVAQQSNAGNLGDSDTYAVIGDTNGALPAKEAGIA